MTTRYRILDDEDNVVGELRLSDGLPVAPELANPRQFAAWGGKCSDLARATGQTKPDWEKAAREATAAQFDLDPEASRTTWTWEQMHWALDWLSDRLAEAKAPAGVE